MVEKSRSLKKIGTRLKGRKGSYGNVEEMLRGKRDKKGIEVEKEEKEIFGRSKKTPRLSIRKRKEGKDMGEEEARGLRKELKEMFSTQKEELNEVIKTQEARLNESLSETISTK